MFVNFDFSIPKWFVVVWEIRVFEGRYFYITEKKNINIFFKISSYVMICNVKIIIFYFVLV